MIAIDSNILVRILTNDSSDKTGEALRLINESSTFISMTVLLEVEIVLRRVYRIRQLHIVDAFRKLMEVEGLVVEDPERLDKALEYYEQGLSFADALNVAAAYSHADRFYTFDNRLMNRLASLAKRRE